MLKSRSGMDVVSIRWESIFVQGLHTSVLVLETFKFKILKCDFQLPTITRVQSNINLSKLHDFVIIYILTLCVPSEFFPAAKDVYVFDALYQPPLYLHYSNQRHIYVLLLFRMRPKYFLASNQGLTYTSFMYFASSQRRV